MNSSIPAISIIVPIYNVEPYLEQCLESIQAQTLSDIEAILVDDGSPDESGAIADSFAAKDGRFTVIHKKNEGVSAARNDGLAKARGEYVFLLDADDYLAENAMEVLYERAQETHADVVLSDYVAFSEVRKTPYQVAGQEFSTKSRDEIDAVQLAVFNMGPARIERNAVVMLRGVGAAWHYLIKRSLIVENNLRFDPSLKGLFDDGTFILNVLEKAESVSYISCPTYFYRHVPNSITRKFGGTPFSKYENVYCAIESFIEANDKGEDFRKGLSLRKFIYLNKSMETYFLNPQNPLSESDRYAEFVSLAKSAPYSDAIKTLEVSHLGCANSAILVSLLRAHMYKAFWLAKKIAKK